MSFYYKYIRFLHIQVLIFGRLTLPIRPLEHLGWKVFKANVLVRVKATGTHPRVLPALFRDLSAQANSIWL